MALPELLIKTTIVFYFILFSAGSLSKRIRLLVSLTLAIGDYVNEQWKTKHESGTIICDLLFRPKLELLVKNLPVIAGHTDM